MVFSWVLLVFVCCCVVFSLLWCLAFGCVSGGVLVAGISGGWFDAMRCSVVGLAFLAFWVLVGLI